MIQFDLSRELVNAPIGLTARIRFVVASQRNDTMRQSTKSLPDSPLRG